MNCILHSGHVQSKKTVCVVYFIQVFRRGKKELPLALD